MLPALVRFATRGKLTVFIFHRVLTSPDELRPDEPDAARFEEEIRWITEWFEVLPLVDAVARLRAGRLGSRTAVLTFDDGYRDNLEVALPILTKHHAPATFFISTSFTEGRCMFNDIVIEAVRAAPGPELDLSRAELGRWSLVSLADRRLTIAGLLQKVKYMAATQRAESISAILEVAGVPEPSGFMMNAAELRILANSGMSIGAHTCTHPILARLSVDEAREEIAHGRGRLTEITGARVDSFAYPNGIPGRDYRDEHVELVRTLGFSVACSTRAGVATGETDPFQLPRFRPWDRSKIGYALRLCQNSRRNT